MSNPTFVQSCTSGQPSSKIAANCVFTGPNTAGNCIVVYNGGLVGLNVQSVVFDSQGNSYQQVFWNQGNYCMAWVALNVKGGNNTVYVKSGDASAQYFNIVALEYANVAQVYGIESSLYLNVTTSGSGPYTVSMGNVVTQHANDIILAAYGTDLQTGPIWTAGAGYTLRQTSGGPWKCGAIQEYVPGVAGTYATSMTSSLSPSNVVGGVVVLSGTQCPVACYNRNYKQGAAGAHSSLSTPPVATTTGKTMVVAIGLWDSLPSNVASVQDTAGNTYTAIASSSVSNTGAGAVFYKCANAVGHPSNVVTVNYTATVTFSGMAVYEITSNLSDPFDKASTGTGSGTAATVSSFTPTNDNELLLAVVAAHAGGTWVAGAGWVAEGIATNTWDIESLLQGTKAAATAPFTIPSSSWSDSAVALMGTTATSTISGNAGAAGVQISYTGSLSGSVTSDAGGAYSITLPNGTYTITPSVQGGTFSPTSASETVSGSNITGVNFTASYIPLDPKGPGVWMYQGISIATAGGDSPGQPNVLYETGSVIIGGGGPVFKMWYGDFVAGVHNVYYAESADGVTWTKYSGNPIIVGRGYPRIFKNSGTYYIYALNVVTSYTETWTSTDGIVWTLAQAQAILPKTGVVGQLSVLGQSAGTWYGYYTLFIGSQYPAGLATSTDLINWTTTGSPVISGEIAANFSFQKIGSLYYGWTQVVQPGIPAFGSLGLPNDIGRYVSSSLTGPWTVLPASTSYRIDSTMGIGTTVGQVGDPCLLSVNGDLYMYLTIDPIGTVGTTYQIACWKAPNTTFEQLIQSYEGDNKIPQPSSFGFANQLNTLVTDPFTAGDTNFTTMTTASGWGAPTFQNGSATGTTSGVKGCAIYTGGGASWAQDQWASATIKTVANASCYAGLVVRGSTVGNPMGYVLKLKGGPLPGTLTLTLSRYVGIVLYDSDIINLSVTAAVGDVVTLAAVGSQISAYYNANLLWTFADTFITTGAPGIFLVPDATPGNAAISSFSAGNYSATVGGNAGAAGVTVTDGTHITTSDANGDYILGPNFGPVTITPTKAGRTFSPATSSKTVAGANITSVDFSQSISGSGDLRFAEDFNF